MIYQKMQQALENRYDLRIPYQVKHFVSHDEDMLQHLTGAEKAAPEMLLIREESDNLDITLFLEQRLIDSTLNVSTVPLRSKQFNNYCTILEGVSHFVYLVWNAQYGRQIKPIEMELQAEVDKYVFSALSEEAPSTREQHKEISNNLFENVTYTHAADSNLHHRYRTANAFAQRYCGWLSRQYSFTNGNRLLYAELARFYRMNAAAKFAHIQQAGG